MALRWVKLRDSRGEVDQIQIIHDGIQVAGGSGRDAIPYVISLRIEGAALAGEPLVIAAVGNHLGSGIHAHLERQDSILLPTRSEQVGAGRLRLEFAPSMDDVGTWSLVLANRYHDETRVENATTILPRQAAPPDSSGQGGGLSDLYPTIRMPLSVGSGDASAMSFGRFIVNAHTTDGRPVSDATIFVAPVGLGTLNIMPGDPARPLAEGVFWRFITDQAGQGISPRIPAQHLGRQFDLLIAKRGRLMLERGFALNGSTGWQSVVDLDFGSQQ